MLTEVTLATETPDRRRVVHSYFLLFGIVANSLSNVSVAMTAKKRIGRDLISLQTGGEQGLEARVVLTTRCYTATRSGLLGYLDRSYELCQTVGITKAISIRPQIRRSSLPPS